MQVLLMATMASAAMAVSTTNELDWSSHYANAKVQAAEEHRPLLVVLENSDDPAGRFDQDRLASESQRELLKHYRLCRMDVNTDYGKRVANAFGAKSFPFTAITDSSAQYITFQASGSMTTEKWEQTLQTRMSGQVSDASVRRVETSKVITDWPTEAVYSVPSDCPNCVRNQYYR